MTTEVRRDLYIYFHKFKPSFFVVATFLACMQLYQFVSNALKFFHLEKKAVLCKRILY